MMMPDQTRVPASVLVDAHVHFYFSYSREVFLDSALGNFRRGAAELGLPEGSVGFLLLTEAGTARWFRRWQDGQDQEGEAWRLEPTAEAESLTAVRATGERLIVVAGRQVATQEGLEVLALGKDLEIQDGQPLADTLERVCDSGALPVIPWGFGKWWGRRGAQVGAILGEDRELFLGDSAGRPQPGVPPRPLRKAREQGTRVLPGTDPLPFPRHATRAGSYGFVLPGAPDEQRPAADLLRRIRQNGQPQTFGRRAGLLRFLRDQTAMQLRRGERQLGQSVAREPNAKVAP